MGFSIRQSNEYVNKKLVEALFTKTPKEFSSLANNCLTTDINTK